MSSETSTSKARSNAITSPDGDHRKRRRNRTTQSCLNCHTSKRMCDRKRPACARCTQLGLTGLCVYEVDDPRQRTESQGESSRLLKRVAELEGVIRGLKNKPHPKWVQSTGGSGDEFEKWHPRSQKDASESTASSSAPSPSSSSSISDRADVLFASASSSRASSTSKSLTCSPSMQDNLHTISRYGSSSPQSTPSPLIATPVEEFCPSMVTVSSSESSSHEYDLASIFLPYPSPALGPVNGSDTLLLKDIHLDHSQPMKYRREHCGCLHEPSSYNAVLELSLRLRRAADALARSPNHLPGSGCPLYQRVCDIDAFASNALGNIGGSREDLSLGRQRHLSMEDPYFQPLMQNFRPWNMAPTVNSADDSFMSWEPGRQNF